MFSIKPANMYGTNNTMAIVNSTIRNSGRYTFKVEQRHQLLKTYTIVEVEGKGKLIAGLICF